MKNNLTAKEVSAETVTLLVNETGLIPAFLVEDLIWVETESGMSYAIQFHNGTSFMKVSTCFVLNRNDFVITRRFIKALAKRTSPNFSVFENRHDELFIEYFFDYEYGLIPKQFVATLNRFDSLVDRINHVLSDNVLYFPRDKQKIRTESRRKVLSI